jgi:hypothetical protein
MKVCVIDCDLDFPWGDCRCEELPRHLHLSKRKAEREVSRGGLRFRAKGKYQKVRLEKAEWKVKVGATGFVSVQMV